MKETGLTGKRRSTTIAATPDDGKSQSKRRRRRRYRRRIIVGDVIHIKDKRSTFHLYRLPHILVSHIVASSAREVLT